MSKKAYRAKVRRALLALSLVLVTMMVAVGGTIAWLTASTPTVTNTFSPSTIAIELKEHDYVFADDALNLNKEVEVESDYKMVPGDTLPKDPFVRVLPKSENCYVFVKITESNFSDYMDYAVNSTYWQQVPNVPNVYYYGTSAGLTKVEYSENPQILGHETTGYILANNQVEVKDSVKKSQMDALITAGTKPTLSFTAYAVQAENLDVTAIADIWNLASAQQ